MSLLIPTKGDFLDAHSKIEEEEIYRSKIKKIEDQLEWNFEVVPGFFKQTDEDTDDLTFNYATSNMGRLKSWEEIISELKSLNDDCGENEVYKLVFFARHGQGYHNLCVAKYGLEEWDAKWHSMTTDGEITWAPDPKLTPLGEDQAKENHELWKKEILLGAPIPSKFYVSPMQRSMNTSYITWKGIRPDDIVCKVKESLRETVGINLCDKRSPKSTIDERFSKFGFDAGEISEDDQMYGIVNESLSDHSVRVNGFLQGLFEEDCVDGKISKDSAKKNTFISTTSHAGTIRSFITVLHHRHFTISTGGMIPIVIKGTRKA